MRVLDWRPWAERYLTSLWSEQAPRRSPGVGPFARSWSAIHDRILARRVAGRDPAAGGPLVVSVGNLALGGTGKTPVVIALARDLAARSYRGGVLTRGFRSPLRGPEVVDKRNVLAGDEARLLAESLGPLGWIVVQARSRVAGLRHLLEAAPEVKIVLLEDGHQTAAVGRHLDVVILDHWQVQPTAAGDRVAAATGRVFPLGPWRESTTGADRAAIWLLETGTAVPERGVGGARVVTFQRHLRCRGVNAGAQSAEQPRRPALVSGIARPQKFEAGATTALNDVPLLAVRLADHEPYRPRLVQKIRQAMDQAGCASLVTTAKDWIKLAPFWGAERPAYVMDLEIVWGNGETLSDLVEERL